MQSKFTKTNQNFFSKRGACTWFARTRSSFGDTCVLIMEIWHKFFFLQKSGTQTKKLHSIWKKQDICVYVAIEYVLSIIWYLTQGRFTNFSLEWSCRNRINTLNQWKWHKFSTWSKYQYTLTFLGITDKSMQAVFIVKPRSSYHLYNYYGHTPKKLSFSDFLQLGYWDIK